MATDARCLAVNVTMKIIADQLAEVPGSLMFGFNMSVLGVVHVADVEAALKIAVLSATLALTLLTGWIKWKNRDKPNEDL